MKDDRKYVVICWNDSCGLRKKLKKDHSKELHDLIEIRRYINIRSNIESINILNQNQEPLYVVMSYNPNLAGGKDFSAWAFSHCYRIKTSKKKPIFKKDILPAGSKILFYQNDFIIGGFTVVRYEIIEKPETEKELNLYKKLTDYPASLYTVSIEDYKKSHWERGHIFYIDFFDVRDFKKRFSNYVGKKMSHHGKINITKEQYYDIIGN